MHTEAVSPFQAVRGPEPAACASRAGLATSAEQDTLLGTHVSAAQPHCLWATSSPVKGASRLWK